MILVDIYRRLVAIGGIHKASKAKINDVLFRIPFICFSIGYIEMLITLTYSRRYARLKSLELSIKNI